MWGVRRTQFPRVPAPIPRSRAISTTGLRVSRTIRTAPALNSGSYLRRVCDIAPPHRRCLHDSGGYPHQLRQLQNPSPALRRQTQLGPPRHPHSDLKREEPVKASIVFLRRLDDGESVDDDEPIFMALPKNIGYDAAGRKTFEATVTGEVEKQEKHETHRCELFDYDVVYDWSTGDDGKKGWTERSRTVAPDTGLVHLWRGFLTDPSGVRDNSPVTQQAFYAGGLDDVVLEALGIDPAPTQVKVFKTLMKDVRKSRLDPDFHSPKFRALRKCIMEGQYTAKKVEDICEYIESGFAAGPAAQAHDYHSGIPHLRPLNLNVYGQLSLDGTKFVPKTSVTSDDLCKFGDVLFNNTNSTEMVGKSAVFELPQDCACSNHVTRLGVETSELNPHYLAAVLNALRSTGYLGLLSTNFNNQAGINASTLKELYIPVPPLKEQMRIAADVERLRGKAKDLIAKARLILSGD